MMNLLRLIGGRTASAPVARERLQILLAHERGLRGRPDLLGVLRAEILAVVRGISCSIRKKSSSG
jgi:cell division topological specificity factor